MARSPSVIVGHRKAFIIYHTEPHRAFHKKFVPLEKITPKEKQTVLQMIELEVWDGILVVKSND